MANLFAEIHVNVGETGVINTTVPADGFELSSVDWVCVPDDTSIAVSSGLLSVWRGLGTVVQGRDSDGCLTLSFNGASATTGYTVFVVSNIGTPVAPSYSSTNFPAADLIRVVGELVDAVYSLRRESDRAIKVPEWRSDGLSTVQFVTTAEQRAGNILGFDETGYVIVGFEDIPKVKEALERIYDAVAAAEEARNDAKDILSNVSITANSEINRIIQKADEKISEIVSKQTTLERCTVAQFAAMTVVDENKYYVLTDTDGVYATIDRLARTESLVDAAKSTANSALSNSTLALNRCTDALARIVGIEEANGRVFAAVETIELLEQNVAATFSARDMAEQSKNAAADSAASAAASAADAASTETSCRSCLTDTMLSMTSALQASQAAEASASAAAASATEAGTKAYEADQSASASADNAYSAAASATSAEQSKNAASASATSAEQSKVSAQTAQTGAEAARDDILTHIEQIDKNTEDIDALKRANIAHYAVGFMARDGTDETDTSGRSDWRSRCLIAMNELGDVISVSAGHWENNDWHDETGIQAGIKFRPWITDLEDTENYGHWGDLTWGKYTNGERPTRNTFDDLKIQPWAGIKQIRRRGVQSGKTDVLQDNSIFPKFYICVKTQFEIAFPTSDGGSKSALYYLRIISPIVPRSFKLGDKTINPEDFSVHEAFVSSPTNCVEGYSPKAVHDSFEIGSVFSAGGISSLSRNASGDWKQRNNFCTEASALSSRTWDGGRFQTTALQTRIYGAIRDLMEVEFATMDIQSVNTGATGNYSANMADNQGDWTFNNAVSVDDASLNGYSDLITGEARVVPSGWADNYARRNAQISQTDVHDESGSLCCSRFCYRGIYGVYDVRWNVLGDCEEVLWRDNEPMDFPAPADFVPDNETVYYYTSDDLTRQVAKYENGVISACVKQVRESTSTAWRSVECTEETEITIDVSKTRLNLADYLAGTEFESVHKSANYIVVFNAGEAFDDEWFVNDWCQTRIVRKKDSTLDGLVMTNQTSKTARDAIVAKAVGDNAVFEFVPAVSVKSSNFVKYWSRFDGFDYYTTPASVADVKTASGIDYGYVSKDNYFCKLILVGGLSAGSGAVVRSRGLRSWYGYPYAVNAVWDCCSRACFFSLAPTATQDGAQ